MRRFNFVLRDDDVLRSMNRQQYKAYAHWLRDTARIVDKSINWDKVNQCVLDCTFYGYSELSCAETLI